MAKVKRKAEVVRAPADKSEASAFLAEIGAKQRDLVVIKAAQEEAVAAANGRAAAEAAPLEERIATLTRGLQLWAEANRDALTEGGKTKTVALPTGDVSWRLRPPSVRISNAAGVIAEAVRAGLDKFLRTKVEVNKEAMLADQANALTLPGVSIGSAGEEFVVAPHEAPPGNGAPAQVAPQLAGSMAA
ncbi:host-nuclease inhibitor Gam family protein [Falsiroseomonas sp.]|uniref:host-nuclease inhibitor Gam family protein n=1 Tax=Falsiroseomonas sp. TaxID=2870721 RepID=UPI00272BAAE4|nr:host-nuclease inhibitor Gam family protein [Falsiroseomonas sp.]